MFGLLVMLFSFAVNAQSLVERRANKLFDQFAYAQAVELYKVVLKKEPNNKPVVNKLAESYRKLNRPADAVVYYAKMMDNGTASVDDYLHYAQALKSVGNNDLAKRWYEKYQQAVVNDGRARRYVESIENHSLYFQSAQNFSVKNSRLSTALAEFSPIYFADGLLITASSERKSFLKSAFPWTNQAFYDLYKVSFAQGDSTFGDLKPLPLNVNSKYHDGPASISPDGRTFAFTRNNFKKGKTRRSIERVNKLKIFLADADGQDFKNVREFTYNSNQYATAHPCFAQGGKVLYFASDMSGGYGGMDLYRSRWANGSWGKPENLGPDINTEGNEVFPFVAADSVLFFASNGLGGLGGLDLFAVLLDAQGNASKPENLGFPVNTQFDDFGLTYRPQSKTGFFSSNREGGKGQDDIYRFVYHPKPYTIVVLDDRTGEPLQDATIQANNARNESFNGSTNKDGKLEWLLRSCETYQVSASLKGYHNFGKDINLPCPADLSKPLEIRLKRPMAKGNLKDKFKGTAIADAQVELYNLEENTRPIATEKTNSNGLFQFHLMPCTQYRVVAKVNGMPDAVQEFQSPCEAADDVQLNLLTGIPPLRGVNIRLRVVDEQSGQALAGAKVNLLTKGENELIPMQTDADGIAETILKEGTQAQVVATKVGYFSTSKSKTEIKIAKGDKTISRELRLLKLKEGGIIALEGIFYDLNKSDIRPDAAKVLDYVVQVMEENPSMVIELGSHTDSRGSDADNLRLSEARAASAAAYIISKGIEAARITGKGYGETQLKNNCGNGVKCPENLHQENRRTEIRILDY